MQSKTKTVKTVRKNKPTKVVTTTQAVRARQNPPKKQRIKKVSTPDGKFVLVSPLPECSMHYADALVNPFDTNGGVCIPYGYFPYNSQKTKAFVRGRFALGTTGFGFIIHRPVSVNDGPTLKFTGSTSVGSAATLFNAYTNVGTANFTQLPFPTAAVTANTVESRVVASGLRVKYVGALSARNGTVVGFEEPDHRNLDSLYSFDSTSTHPVSMMERVGGDEWDMTVCYSGPSIIEDIDFAPTTTPLGNAYFMGIAISGVAGDVYEFELYEHLEYIGISAVSKTPSHLDPKSLQIVAAAKEEAANGPLQPEKTASFWDKIKSNMSELLPRVVQMGSTLYNQATRSPSTGVSPSLGGIMNFGLQMARHQVTRGHTMGLEGVRLLGNGNPDFPDRTGIELSHDAHHAQRRNVVILR